MADWGTPDYDEAIRFEIARQELGLSRDAKREAQRKLRDLLARPPREGPDSPEMSWFKEYVEHYRGLLHQAHERWRKAREFFMDPRDRAASRSFAGEVTPRGRRKSRKKARFRSDIGKELIPGVRIEGKVLDALNVVAPWHGRELITDAHPSFDSDGERQLHNVLRVKQWRREQRLALLRDLCPGWKCPCCGEERRATQLVAIPVAELTIMARLLPLARDMLQRAARDGRELAAVCRGCHRRYLA